MSLYALEFINLNNLRFVKQVEDFLRNFDLTYNASEVEFTLVLKDDDEIIATGSFNGRTLQNVAVTPHRQGEGLTAQMISELIQEQARRGQFHYFLYTKPDNVWLFSGLGLKEVADSRYAVLLEGGLGSLSQYLAQAKKHIEHLPAQRAALIMNGYPFTLGHRDLIEKAAQENEGVIVFISENGTSNNGFNLADRLALAKDGTADLNNVAIIGTGPYQVTPATFPTYFTKGEQQQIAPAELDAKLFAEKIAPALGINRRYVGSEPDCPVAAEYNHRLSEILPQSGIDVIIVPPEDSLSR